MPKRRNRGNCIYCGKYCTLTRDHIPPSSIFGHKKPDPPVIVPACNDCHDSYKMDDEYFRNTLAAHISANSLNAKAASAAFIRSLQYEEASRHRERFLSGLIPVQLLSAEGKHLGESLAYNVDLERLHRVAFRIVRGLYYHNTKAMLPINVAVNCATGDVIQTWEPDHQQSLYQNLAVIHAQPEYVIGDVNTFRYRYALHSQTDRVSIWLLTVYAAVDFVAITSPPDLPEIQTEKVGQ